MTTQHRAQITWSAQQASKGLPAITKIASPSWFTEPGLGSDEGWTLVCLFDTPPSKQGNPSAARVEFLVEEAPHERLRPGAILRLFESGAHEATVEILE